LEGTILDDGTALQNMVEEMYPELSEREPVKKKALIVENHSVYDGLFAHIVITFLDYSRLRQVFIVYHEICISSTGIFQTSTQF
jgi:hypothetical protein